jgi:hypothetical protein
VETGTGLTVDSGDEHEKKAPHRTAIKNFALGMEIICDFWKNSSLL